MAIAALAQVEAAAAAVNKTVAKTLATARFRLRHPSAALNERQHKVLHRLLDAGPEGLEGGINTRKYMSVTLVVRGAV